MDRAQITPALATTLIAEQFPQWADLAVRPVELDGWDNATFRLGEALSVRLPSAAGYVAQVDKEHRWLPFLGPQLPVAIPEPVARGRPGCGYPWPWSIYRWIEGEHPSSERSDDVDRLAGDLAGFLAALHTIDPTDAPPPGAHNSDRGGSLVTYDAETRDSVEQLAAGIDTAGAIEVWDAALNAAWEQPPVWVHGDLTATNLLVADGQLRAVVDFGGCAVGDPACDLVMAWTYFADRSRRVFRDSLRLDDATWSRARGWALWKALITLAGAQVGGPDAESAAARFGWLRSARHLVGDVIADHRRPT